VQQWATAARFVDADSFHESTVRNGATMICDEILAPDDIVVVLDADEELRAIDGSPARPVLETLDASDQPGPWPVQFWHLWAPDGTQHRVDPLWQPSVGHRLYRHQKGLRVSERAIACPAIPVPQPRSAPYVQLGVAHWGYARPHDRIRKHEYYMRVDGGRYHNLSHLESIVTEPTLEPVPCPS
jgi:hypothetical protein